MISLKQHPLREQTHSMHSHRYVVLQQQSGYGGREDEELRLYECSCEER